MKALRELEVGEVLSFTVKRRHFLCQVIAIEDRGRLRAHEVVVFAGGESKAPRVADIAGRAIHVLKVAPKNQPLYLKIDGQPPAAFRRLGRRPVALGYDLPRTFRTDGHRRAGGRGAVGAADHTGGARGAGREAGGDGGRSPSLVVSAPVRGTGGSCPRRP